MKAVWIPILMSLALPACGNSPVAGRWVGTFEGTQSGTPISYDVSVLIWDDGGGRGSGVWHVHTVVDDVDSSYFSGSLAFEKNGDSYSFEFDQRALRCTGTLSGAADLAGDALAITATGTTTDLGAGPGNTPLPGGIVCGAVAVDLTLEKDETYR